MRTRRWIAGFGLGLAACGSGPSQGGDEGTTGGSTTKTASTGTADTGSSEASAEVSGGSSETGEPEPDPVVPGEDTTVVAFEGAHVFFLGGDEGQNQREIDVDVEFPEAGLGYESITLDLGLRCPEPGGCDWWDRTGWIAVVEDPGTEQERVLEVTRFITPYRVEASWSIDVTRLRPLLTGPRTVRVHIDTWVGPGHANGDGWLVDARFDLVGGVLSPRPLQVIPLWSLETFEVGDPAQPPDAQVVPQTVQIGAETTRLELVSIITGHGQGNLQNCAEFCPMTHGYLVGDQPRDKVVWREDCGENPIDDQAGTWMYPRAGWCPGADVIPWVEDVSPAIPPDGELTVVYDLQDYENTCRPDAPECSGCALNTGCDYDGGSHTPPVFNLTTYLVTYTD